MPFPLNDASFNTSWDTYWASHYNLSERPWPVKKVVKLYSRTDGNGRKVSFLALVFKLALGYSLVQVFASVLFSFPKSFDGQSTNMASKGVPDTLSLSVSNFRDGFPPTQPQLFHTLWCYRDAVFEPENDMLSLQVWRWNFVAWFLLKMAPPPLPEHVCCPLDLLHLLLFLSFFLFAIAQGAPQRYSSQERPHLSHWCSCYR